MQIRQCHVHVLGNHHGPGAPHVSLHTLSPWGRFPTLCTGVWWAVLRTVYSQAQGCVYTALQLGGDVEQPRITNKYDVIHKYISSTYITDHYAAERRTEPRPQVTCTKKIAVSTLSGNSLRQTAHTHRASATKLVAALLGRVARVTAGLAESRPNDNLPPGLWLTSAAGWLSRTGISSRTLRSVIEYGLYVYLFRCTVWLPTLRDSEARTRYK